MDTPAAVTPRPPATEPSPAETVTLVEIEDLFDPNGGGAWIEGCEGVTIGSVSCPATVASAFSFT